MINDIFQNIVEVYAKVSKDLNENPNLDNNEFEKVIDFCLNDKNCMAEKNIKRNMLLFWAFSKLAKAKQKEGKYKEALEILQKAKKVVVFDGDKIKLGNKMMEIITVMNADIHYKALLLTDVSFFLQEVYAKNGDVKNVAKQKKLQEVAEKLLKNSPLKH